MRSCRHRKRGGLAAAVRESLDPMRDARREVPQVALANVVLERTTILVPWR